MSGRLICAVVIVAALVLALSSVVHSVIGREAHIAVHYRAFKPKGIG